MNFNTVECPHCGMVKEIPFRANYGFVKEKVEELGCQGCRAQKTLEHLQSGASNDVLAELGLSVTEVLDCMTDFWARTGWPQSNSWIEAIRFRAA